ncbi:hypothetical protein [Mycolicibacterium mucogenicum]|uniref:Uncharacterized protein n=1 Tax=Mycolicibacterium mucogenicum DSM 44124 TaxID=1226753 RepID=A0A8H2JAK7_MYCMU|nr:hypothetical protein [Mycolicibacterium mucogenicum]KAB7754260.1 hypothetical protein MMUC44124_23075 [Mycolicibacterium mucogenicum DSM 44124]QPG70875.1 hypothetical protein C1S78_007975 [Mycolicibacterium mucogenicum DSM 44124]
MTAHHISNVHRVGCATITVGILAAAQVTHPLIAAPATAATGQAGVTVVQFTSLSTVLNSVQRDLQQQFAVVHPKPTPTPTPTSAGTMAAPSPTAAVVPTPTAALSLPSLPPLPTPDQIVAAISAIPATIALSAVGVFFVSALIAGGFLQQFPIFQAVPQLAVPAMILGAVVVAPFVIGLAVFNTIRAVLPLAATAAGTPAPVATVNPLSAPAPGASTDTTADPAADTTHRAPPAPANTRTTPANTRAGKTTPATALGTPEGPDPTLPTADPQTSPKPGRQAPPRSDPSSSSATQHGASKNKKPKSDTSSPAPKGKPDKA